ncbi:MAG: DUF2950 domain-containing protein [Tepidisphaeraceae bacterium]|jgi:hypothetical protein
MNIRTLRNHVLAAVTIISLMSLAGCAGKPESEGDVRLSQENPGMPEPGQRMFASPEEAAGVLKDAMVARDRRLLIAIFGPEGKQYVLTGDRVEEDTDMQAFGQHMSEHLLVDRPSADKAVLQIGKENWPFPIPVVKNGEQWFFDTAAGKQELLNRRIGENELGAIAVCRAHVAAQKEYASKPRNGDSISQYAQHFMSTEGKKDGLYWPAAAGEELSPMGPLVAEAREEGYIREPRIPGKPHPYHGYFFHILTAQGEAAPGGKMSYIVDGRMTKGFAVVASPSSWGSSGVMTFIVNQDGKVYQKNLGENTRELVKTITEYNPDNTWTEVKD